MKLSSNFTKTRSAFYIPWGPTHQCWRRQKKNYTTDSTEKSSLKIFDIVCVGGGPAGLSLLAALRSSPITANLKIALIESQDIQKIRHHSPLPSQFSNRCSSLTPSSVRFLHDIGAWKYIKLERIQAYHEMQVWDGVSDARIQFQWHTAKKWDTIAYMLENINLTSALLGRIGDLGGISIFDNQKVASIGFGEETDDLDLRDWPVLELSCGIKMAARLLVGADGSNSCVRTFAGIESKGWDYEREGVVATLESKGNETTNHGMRTAYQRFLPTGPVAMLPLPGNYSTLVWSTTLDRSSQLKKLCPKDFVAVVNAAFRLSPTDLSYMHSKGSNQLDEFEWRSRSMNFDEDRIPSKIVEVQPGSIASFPLKLRHANTYIGERIALVGDAAHSVHPLAGQGLNQGQADVESLVKNIIYATNHGQDIGDKMVLERYNAERYAMNNMVLGVIDKLHKLYSVEKGPLIPIRSIGLRLVDSLGPLKYFFMDQASGTNVDIRSDSGNFS